MNSINIRKERAEKKCEILEKKNTELEEKNTF